MKKRAQAQNKGNHPTKTKKEHGENVEKNWKSRFKGQ